MWLPVKASLPTYAHAWYDIIYAAKVMETGELRLSELELVDTTTRSLLQESLHCLASVGLQYILCWRTNYLGAPSQKKPLYDIVVLTIMLYSMRKAEKLEQYVVGNRRRLVVVL